MTTSFSWKHLLSHALLVFGLGLTAGARAEPCVELTVEVQMDPWDNLFFFDREGQGAENRFWHTLFGQSDVRRCVVGTNRWMIDSETTRGRRTYWFDGTNLVEESASGGTTLTEMTQSVDGNPGRPVRVVDRMVFDWSGKAFWLALCSGPCLKHEGRTLYPPCDIWKETLVSSTWKDEVETFPDSLGLPKSVTLLTTNQQTIYRYRVHSMTNAFGWTLPLEFYGVQYSGGGHNGWYAELTYKGRVTAIRPAEEKDLQVPPEVLKRAKREEE